MSEEKIEKVIKVPKKHLHFNFEVDGITYLTLLKNSFNQSGYHRYDKNIIEYINQMKARQKVFIIISDEYVTLDDVLSVGFLNNEDMEIK